MSDIKCNAMWWHVYHSMCMLRISFSEYEKLLWIIFGAPKMNSNDVCVWWWLYMQQPLNSVWHNIMPITDTFSHTYKIIPFGYHWHSKGIMWWICQKNRFLSAYNIEFVWIPLYSNSFISFRLAIYKLINILFMFVN